jgi:hypothetical protein
MTASPVRVLVPAGMLGAGFTTESISRGIALGADAIAIDGGSTDSGPAGAVVKQRSHFGAGTEIDGLPAVDVGRISGRPPMPAWALRYDELPVPTPRGDAR